MFVLYSPPYLVPSQFVCKTSSVNCLLEAVGSTVADNAGPLYRPRTVYNNNSLLC